MEEPWATGQPRTVSVPRSVPSHQSSLSPSACSSSFWILHLSQPPPHPCPIPSSTTFLSSSATSHPRMLALWGALSSPLLKTLSGFVSEVCPLPWQRDSLGWGRGVGEAGCCFLGLTPTGRSLVPHLSLPWVCVVLTPVPRAAPWTLERGSPSGPFFFPPNAQAFVFVFSPPPSPHHTLSCRCFLGHLHLPRPRCGQAWPPDVPSPELGGREVRAPGALGLCR